MHFYRRNKDRIAFIRHGGAHQLVNIRRGRERAFPLSEIGSARFPTTGTEENVSDAFAKSTVHMRTKKRRFFESRYFAFGKKSSNPQPKSVDLRSDSDFKHETKEICAHQFSSIQVQQLEDWEKCRENSPKKKQHEELSMETKPANQCEVSESQSEITGC